jgi:filamentous hemagglutinin family protein
MHQALKSLFFKTFPLAILSSIAAITNARAQITPDNSLGNESSTVTQDNINGIPSDLINGGAARGDNLFHSFQDFNIGEGRGAYFANPAGILNILSRVTGGNASTILGKLGVLGDANLFLINPAGILFGENASLDVKGSFVGTTADSVVFGDGFEFSASNPDAPPLLTINIPNGLRFRDNPGDIVNRSIFDGNNALFVPAGETLALIGGNINFDGGQVFALGGKVELGGLTQAGTVTLNDDFSVSFPNDVTKADISLTNNSFVDVSDDGEGRISINARNLELSNSFLIAGIYESLGTPEAQAGDININTTGDITLKQESQIRNTVSRNSTGNGGNVNIQTNSLNLTQGSLIGADTFGLGNSGKVKITASDAVSVDGRGQDGFNSSIVSDVSETAVGNAGGIDIVTGNLTLANGGQIDTSTFGQGNAGAIAIDAKDTISIDGTISSEDTISSGIISVVGTGAKGNGSDIKIATTNLSLTNGAGITTGTAGQGNAGAIAIDASNSISINGRNLNGVAGIFTRVEQEGVGNAGNIKITTNDLSLANDGSISAAIRGEGDAGDIEIATSSLTLTQGSEISSSTFGKGDGGVIKITASDRISVDGQGANGFPSGILSAVNEEAVGNADGIEIATKDLDLTNGGVINSSTYGQGNAGSIKINASNTISADGASQSSGIFSSVAETGVGDAGAIEIATSDLTLTNEGVISSSTFGQGNAGGIKITASNTISADDSGIFSAVNETAIGNAGDIEIATSKLSLIQGGTIDVSTFGQGNTGNIIIEAKDRLELVNSDILSVVKTTGIGDASKIEIITDNLTLTQGGAIIASTFGRGNAGQIKVTASDTISADGEGEDGFSSGIFSTVNEKAVGDAGGVEIATGNLSLANGGQIDASTFGQGNAGGIKITATDTISADGESPNGFTSGIFSAVNEKALGNAGGIEIATGNLTLTNGSAISSSTFGQGNAGGIKITASNAISADGKSQSSGIFSSVAETGVGNAGGIEIATGNLTLTNGSGISASTFGQGNGGGINIIATDTISVDGKDSERILTGIYSTVENTAIGNASGIEIDTVNLNLTNTGQISSSTFGKGNAGTIKINASDTIFADGARDETISGIFSRVDEIAEGNAGGIEIATNNLTLSNQSQINVGIFGKTNPEIESGNLDFTVNNLLLLRNNGLISAQATGDNNGGNVTINNNDGFIVASPNQNNDIVANAGKGRGGNIEIDTQRIFGLKERPLNPFTNDINASSEFGLQGNISIDTPDIDPSRGLIDLTQTVTDPEDQIAQNPCTKGKDSEFYITGRGGIVPKPYDIINPDGVEVGLVDPVSESRGAEVQRSGGDEEKIQATEPKQEVPAQGWIFTKDGRVMLTSYDPTGVGGVRSRQNPSSCPAPEK